MPAPYTIPDSTFMITKTAERPNSAMSVRAKDATAAASTTVRYENFFVVTVPGSISV